MKSYDQTIERLTAKIEKLDKEKQAKREQLRKVNSEIYKLRRQLKKYQEEIQNELGKAEE